MGAEWPKLLDDEEPGALTPGVKRALRGREQSALAHVSDTTSRTPCRVSPDPLSDVLADLRLSSASYGMNEFSTPWGLELPREAGARFHFVARGHCWVRRANRAPVRLDEGDVVLLPHGDGHTIGDTADGPATMVAQHPLTPLSDSAIALRDDGDGVTSLIVCCTATFAGALVHPLLELMPELMLVRGEERRDPTLSMLLEAMAAEIVGARVGAATVTTRFADIVIVRVIRSWLERHSGEVSGWLAAIRDPQLARALAAIHKQPESAWSIAALARTARMSRSLFAERFANTVGLPPARYVERWRIHLARNMLRTERVTVSELAERLGYASEASFRRAFKRVLGVAPRAAKRP